MVKRGNQFFARVLAFDPGHTTGVVGITDGDAYKVALAEAIDEDARIWPILSAFAPSVVVVEWYPQAFADQTTVRIANAVKHIAQFEVGVPVMVLLPGQWKAYRDSKRDEVTPPAVVQRRHVLDAWWMIYYTINGG